MRDRVRCNARAQRDSRFETSSPQQTIQDSDCGGDLRDAPRRQRVGRAGPGIDGGQRTVAAVARLEENDEREIGLAPQRPRGLRDRPVGASRFEHREGGAIDHRRVGKLETGQRMPALRTIRGIGEVHHLDGRRTCFEEPVLLPPRLPVASREESEHHRVRLLSDVIEIEVGLEVVEGGRGVKISRDRRTDGPLDHATRGEVGITLHAGHIGAGCAEQCEQLVGGFVLTDPRHDDTGVSQPDGLERDERRESGRRRTVGALSEERFAEADDGEGTCHALPVALVPAALRPGPTMLPDRGAPVDASVSRSGRGCRRAPIDVVCDRALPRPAELTGVPPVPCWSLVLATLVGAGATSAGDAAEPLVAAAPLHFVFDPAAQDAPVATPEPEMHEAVPSGPEPLVPAFGTRGSSRWYIQGGRGSEFGDTVNTMTVLGLGYGNFIGRAVSIDVELNGVGHSQFGEDAIGVNFNLLFRWHFLVERDWTVYLDGGAGMQYTNEDVPRLGSKFNWTPQAGIGMSLDVGRDNRVLFGCRWHHQSNANLFDSNPGRDSFLGYIQLNFPF